jgi:hypothetical protein
MRAIVACVMYTIHIGTGDMGFYSKVIRNFGRRVECPALFSPYVTLIMYWSVEVNTH